MPLNKLENFIKNTDGRTIYVNPADLNATDSITNQGTSLTEPFRTIQRALLESARFSYVRGDDNDLIERTTIVIYPGEYKIDNRPGYGIKTIDGNPVAVTPSGENIDPFQAFNLTGDSNFDIESPNNVLWRFNSIYGGCVVPRGTSIVGMDLRKTKIRPLYVPNPTDPSVPDSAIFRITGTCYFWQFTVFDGDENGVVFTDNRDFSENNQSKPTFSHNKLTSFEYADGVNPAVANGFELTDLAMYYSKLSNAYNEASGRPIDEKYPEDPLGFAPQRPEFEIVGAFATDPIRIARITSGDGFTPDAVITVDTVIPHELNVDTPIKIRGVAVSDYNISTKVATVLSPTRFTYALSFVRPNLPANPSVSTASVTVETDTVTGASPYIFNVSMRSVWGINGMHADGSKATGFKSMVVAQFTAISLQKDDRSFVKYNQQSRRYDGINLSRVVRGAELAAQSSSTNSATVYHLDPDAIYRPGWETTHIKMSNDAVVQIVSVFAIGFNQHFAALTGADASITNSNSNFGQFSLVADGFKNNAFDKDDLGFITSVIAPRSAYNPETGSPDIIDYINIDFDLTRSIGFPDQLYLKGFRNAEGLAPAVSQGFRIGANYSEQLIQRISIDGQEEPKASIFMPTNLIGPGDNKAVGNGDIGRKIYTVTAGPIGNTLTLAPLGQNSGGHGLINAETIRIFSSTGDLPENVEKATLYYANVVDDQNIRLSTSESNALNNIFINIYGGDQLRIESRVNDKQAGERGHPLQYDYTNNNWFIFTNTNSGIYQYIINNPSSRDGDDFVPYFERFADNRPLDDKLYRVRYVIPKESTNAKPPTPGYVLQASSTTGARNNDDFILNEISINDYEYDRNQRFIVSCVVQSQEIEVRAEKPHNLSVGDKVNIINVTSVDNPDAVNNRGYNGEFLVTRIENARVFRLSITDVNGFTRTPGNFTNNINDRNILLPRFQRKDNKKDIFIYRVEEITEFIEGIRDGIYHLFLVNGSNAITETFTSNSYNQPIEDLYPQQDLDNLRPNPPASRSFAVRAPLGRTLIDEQQNSITRETIDKLYKALNVNIVDSVTAGPPVVDPNTGVSTSTSEIVFEREHEFNAVYGYEVLTGGSGYTDGIYYDIRLLSNFGADWKGATARVVVSAGSVTNVQIMDPGSGYQPNETLFIEGTEIGGGTNATISIVAGNIELNENTVLQFTGGGSINPDTYSYIQSVDSETTISVARTDGSSAIVDGMYAYPCDQGTEIISYTYAPESQISTFMSANQNGFGLQRGNTFVVFDDVGNFLGRHFVSNVPTPDVLEAFTEKDLSVGDGFTHNIALVGKTGLDYNDAPTGSSGENVGVRAGPLLDNGTFYLQDASGTGPELNLRAKDGGVTGSIPEKLTLGRYLQVGSEIMRVSSTTFGGTNDNFATVIRGALGTNITSHPTGSKVKAIKPEAIESRRPAILRASGHTFEYLGYGPGNYSTSLPQLQVRQLSDKEQYLVQAQELSCGQVVYTGMNDTGDFYIGNIRYSATSGTQVTFDIPIPTVAGQDASSNIVVFDEVTINRRLFVAGGENKEVLSQFEGPVKFTSSVTIQNRLVVTDTTSTTTLTVDSRENSTAPTNGAASIRGGVGIERDLYVGGLIDAGGDVNVGSALSVTGDAFVGAALTVIGDIDAGGDLDVEGNLTLGGNLNIEGDIDTGGSGSFFSIRTQNIQAALVGVAMTLFSNQDNSGNNPVIIGGDGDNSKVIFQTTKPGSGQGGDDDIANSDGGVDIKGSLVVREQVIAKEFIGDGLGKPGSIIGWGGNAVEDNEGTPGSIPKGYLLCDGRSLPKPIDAGGSSNTYRKLWNAIRGTHGETSTTFNIPDLRERFVVGAGGDNPNVSGGPYSVAATGGVNSVTLSEDQMPSHVHTINEGRTDHSHNVDGNTDTRDVNHNHGGSTQGAGGHGHGGSTGGAGGHGHGFNTNNNGGHSHGLNAGDVCINFSRQGFDAQGGNEAVKGINRGRIGGNTDNNGGHEHSGNTFNVDPHQHGFNTQNVNNHTHGLAIGAANSTSHSHDIDVSVSAYNTAHNHTNLSTGGDTAHENRPPYFALCYIIQYK